MEITEAAVQEERRTGALADAVRAAKVFADMVNVLGVGVFGSVARGTESEDSDIDLLVLVAKDGPRRSRLWAHLPASLQRRRWGIQVFEHDDLVALMRVETSFTTHLRRELVILFDRNGVLERIITTPAERRLSTREERDAQLRQLASYSNLEVFRGYHLHVLSRLYRVGKAIVMLGLHADGRPIYDRREAFAEFRRRHPELAKQVQTVERLQPFYLISTRREEGPLPFSYRGNKREVQRSIDAINAVAEVVE